MEQNIIFSTLILIFLLCKVNAQVNTTVTFGLVYGETVQCQHLLNKTLHVRGDDEIAYSKAVVLDFDISAYEVSEYRELFKQHDISAVISSYFYNLALATLSLDVPYLLATNNSKLVLQDTTFWFDQIYLDVASATNGLLQSTITTTRLVLLVSDEYLYLRDFTYTLQKLSIPMDIINVYNSMTKEELQRQMLDLKTPFVQTSTFIILLMESEMSFLQRIFDAAIYVGNFNLEQLWIIPSLFLSGDVFNSVRHTKTRFITYSMVAIQKDTKLYSTYAMQQSFCDDAVKQVLLTQITKRDTNISLPIRMANVQYPNTYGTFSYNESRIRVGDDILFMSPYREISAAYDSKLKQVGFWRSSDSTASITDTAISRKQYVVRLATVIDKPFFYESHGKYSGYLVEVMDRIARDNFWINQWTVVPTVGNYNATTNSWDGMMELLVKNKADIGVGAFIVDANRRRVIDFSEILYNFGFTTLARKAPPRFQWLIFLQPFGVWVWFGLAGIFLIQCLTYFSVVQISTLCSRKRKRKVVPINEAFFNMFVTASIAKYPVNASTVATGFYMVCAWFFSLVILSSYAANLVPHLIKKELMGASSQNIETLINNTEGFTWFFPEGEAIAGIIENSSVPVERHLVEKAKANWPNDAFVLGSQAQAVMNLDYKRIFITDDSRATYIDSLDCNFEKGSSTFNMHSGRLLFNKNFTFQKEVNETLISLQNIGYLDELYRVWVSFGQPCPLELSLKIQEMITLFLVPAVGVVMGLIIALIEVLVKRCAICCLRLKLKKLRFGNTYKAEVDAIELNGVQVTIDGRPNKYFLHNSQLHPDPIKSETATSLGLGEGSKFKVRYFGRDPITKSKYFVRDE